jgi:hypothetical protein
MLGLAWDFVSGQASKYCCLAWAGQRNGHPALQEAGARRGKDVMSLAV